MTTQMMNQIDEIIKLENERYILSNEMVKLKSERDSIQQKIEMQESKQNQNQLSIVEAYSIFTEIIMKGIIK
jgi:hypothetical protein